VVKDTLKDVKVFLVGRAEADASIVGRTDSGWAVLTTRVVQTCAVAPGRSGASLAAPQPPRWHAAVEVLGGALLLLHLPLFFLRPPTGALALPLGLGLFALGRALSRRWARDELLGRVDQVEESRKPEPRKPERHGGGIGGDLSALANRRGPAARPGLKARAQVTRPRAVPSLASLHPGTCNARAFTEEDSSHRATGRPTMPRLPLRTCLIVALALLCSTALPAADKEPPRTKERAAVEKEVRQLVARFDKGDPGWKVRLEALVRLARAGPAVVPVLAEALHKGSPSTRELAAQALVLFPEAGARPALERALADPKSGVRLYAIQALSMFGKLPRTERHEQILRNDPSFWGVRPLMAAALSRNDRPNPAQLRKLLADYDLRQLDSARLGEMAPDFTLTDFSGKAYRLSQFRGKKTVVLRFILFDF
jgi:hypothetical protein